MTDQAPKGIAAPLSAGTTTVLRARPVPSLNLGDKVVSLALPAIDEFVAKVEQPAVRDWASALELVREASEAIRVGEERADQLEEHLAEVVREASAEIKRLSDLLAESEQKVAQTEAKADAAEARAVEAERWLAKLHDAVVESFTPVLGRNQAARVSEDERRSAVSG
ncbi:hypothetical protein [Bosea sp. TND4EK4]|uniref:hypothetical protein n=1 Tax=Bosea sp. TND4EK4 TaxID=1907408 RepID=UPI000954C296|nr:hypothetical protein [Bosea sp. TND4EK4]SIQ72822.1 hypothetical protein SAMN05880592_10557 [Bosea sp. TND4EK4]